MKIQARHYWLKRRFYILPTIVMTDFVESLMFSIVWAYFSFEILIHE